MGQNHGGDAPGKAADANDNGLWNQLENAVTLTAKQDQVVWTVFGVFSAAEAVLLAAVFQGGGPPDASIKNRNDHWYLVRVKIARCVRAVREPPDPAESALLLTMVPSLCGLR
jgi:hypothetical protein